MRKIEKFAKKHKIKFVEVAFLDLMAETRQITIPVSRLSSCLKTGLKCDGSSINCTANIENSDTRLFLDENSFYLLPNNKMLVFCFTDNVYDARKNLFDVQQSLCKNKLSINFGAEVEFFLFKKNNNYSTGFKKFGYQSVDFENIDNLRYLNSLNSDHESCLTEIADFCKDKINLEAIHHECANNQYEIDFKYDNPLKTADNIVFVKRVIKYFANKHNLVACFMPKPINNTSGSGMHINMSVFKNNKNLFYDKCDKNNLSEFAYCYMQNIFNHICAITAFTNPIVNSYKRLNGGFEAPTNIEYSSSNRSVLMRIPKATPKTTRLELRSPDVACNPYLAFLAILIAGFENDCKPTLCATAKNLPTNLNQAINFLEKDDLISNIVPKSYIYQKRAEYQTFENQVTNFDLEKYFNI